MSHVLQIEGIPITDLDALAVAAEEIGCELVRDQKNYHWYGVSVGDTALPAGFSAKELGHCEHAIRVKGADRRTYEVGVVRNKTGPGYVLLCDEWQNGYGLIEKIGQGAKTLRQHYNAELAARDRRRHGYKVTKQTVDGRLVIRAQK